MPKRQIDSLDSAIWPALAALTAGGAAIYATRVSERRARLELEKAKERYEATQAENIGTIARHLSDVTNKTVDEVAKSVTRALVGPTQEPVDEIPPAVMEAMRAEQEWYQQPADDWVDPATSDEPDLDPPNLSDRAITIPPGSGIPGIPQPDLTGEYE